MHDTLQTVQRKQAPATRLKNGSECQSHDVTDLTENITFTTWVSESECREHFHFFFSEMMMMMMTMWNDGVCVCISCNIMEFAQSFSKCFFVYVYLRISLSAELKENKKQKFCWCFNDFYAKCGVCRCCFCCWWW